MGEWKEVKLGEIADIIDSLHITPSYVEIGYPMVRVTDIKPGYLVLDNTLKVSKETFDKFSQKHQPKKGDIVFSRVGSYGISSLVQNEQQFCLGQNTVFIVVKQNPYFVYYFLNSPIAKNQIDGLVAGSTQPTISLRSIKELVISSPDIYEQNTIASILSSLDDKIDLLHRQNKTLEQLAVTLFRKWFVEEADESGEEKTLEELIYFNPAEKINRANEYTFYDMRCLSDNSMCINEGEKRTTSSATSFRNDDVLLAKITPCLENGKTGFVMHLQENEIARGSTEFIVMRSKGRVNAYYIYCLSRSSEFRDSAILSMTGTSGRQRVQIDLLKNYLIFYNEIKIEEFGKIVKPYFEKIKINQIQIRTLTQLRDTLLPKLMSGEVRVK